MDRRQFLAAVATAAALAATSQAFARYGAILDRAVPAVGSTGNVAPREVRLRFDREVVAAFSTVQVISSTGAVISASRPVNDPLDQQVVIIRLARALPPGAYMVSWRVFSVDRHLTWGSFHFTVS